MARRNRKKKKMDGFIRPSPFAGIIVLLSALALGYVWLKCRCEAVGREIKTLEGENAELRKKYQNEEYRWTWMKSPGNVEKALAKHNLSMGWPSRGQIVRLHAADIFGSRDDQRPQEAFRVAWLERIARNE